MKSTNVSETLQQEITRNWFITPSDLIIDLKVLIKEYYCATLLNEENKLKISFQNGQTFYISVAPSYD